MGGDFRAAYLPGVALTGAGQVVGLLQFDGYTPSDITYYESRAGLPNVPLTNVLLDGFSGNPTGSGGEVEVSLDIEMAISMAPGLAGVMVYMAGPYGNFHDILNRMATDNLAKQLSCSWYIPGGGPDRWRTRFSSRWRVKDSPSSTRRAITMRLPVRWISWGDALHRAGGRDDTDDGWSGRRLGIRNRVELERRHWERGGISTRYGIPSYQADISMTLNQGSTTMRNIPDVALTADNVYVRCDGRDWDVGARVARPPLWAGFAAVVISRRWPAAGRWWGLSTRRWMRLGTPPNTQPAFMTSPRATTPAAAALQFYAVAGYDLCTGWGTPAGQNLINALATPDPLLVTPQGWPQRWSRRPLQSKSGLADVDQLGHQRLELDAGEHIGMV